jgi:hypothetical protein
MAFDIPSPSRPKAAQRFLRGAAFLLLQTFQHVGHQGPGKIA